MDITNAYNENIKIRPNCGLGNGALVRLSVTDAEDVGGTPLTAANATGQTIFDVESQFAIAFTKGTSTIDVTSPSLRTRFIEEGAAGDILTSANDTDLTASSGVVTVNNDTDTTIEDFIDFATFPAALELTLGTTGNVFTGLDFSGNRVYIDGDGVATTDGANSNFSATTHIATIAVFTVAHGATVTDDVYLGVNGTTILTTQVWPLVATVNFTSASLTDPTGTDSSFVTWTINGYQAIIPYVTTFPGFTTICIADNTSTAVADVMVDILSSESSATDTNLAVGTIPGRTTVRLDFGETEITNFTGGAAAITVGVNTRYAARLTITADQNQVYVNCIQIEPGSPNKRMVPVLTDENAVNWRQ